ncbi:MAG: hypothetical protein IPM11_01270 [Micropruina sp.]|nr:hypothetical protein [Micropruina sp.]
MAITAQIIKSDGAASAAGTVLGTQTLAAPAVWTRLTGLDNTIPKGGALLKVSSNAEAFRFAKVDPVSSGDTAAADSQPDHNGELVPWFGTGSEGVDYVNPGTQVWVKQV